MVPAYNELGYSEQYTGSRFNEFGYRCEVVHETNKAHFRNLLPNRFLPSSVGKALT